MDLRIEKVMAVMRDDLTQRLPLSKMAQLVNLSRARFCHLFKSENGMSASRYLKSLRMKEATVLLSTTFLSVKEIMVRVGFGDESHFVKDFKKMYGVTPTEYRKSKANDNKPRLAAGSRKDRPIKISIASDSNREYEYFDRRAWPRDAADGNISKDTNRAMVPSSRDQ